MSKLSIKDMEELSNLMNLYMSDIIEFINTTQSEAYKMTGYELLFYARLSSLLFVVSSLYKYYYLV